MTDRSVTKQKQTRYQVKGTATVSVWMYIHADSPTDALNKANAGEYEESPEYDTDGEPQYDSVVEAMPR